MTATRPRLPLLTNDDAWDRLPGAPSAREPLPVWARMLAGVLPLTTACALELDALHRTGDRLPSRLRALARSAAADANACDHGKSVAAADFPDLALNPEPATELERGVVDFASSMMTRAYAVTDGEVAFLLRELGESQLVALVLLLAYASYQDRLFLALGLGGAAEITPPCATRFARPRPPTPPTAAPTSVPTPASDAAPTEYWRDLRDSLEHQKARLGRIRIPTEAEMLARMGAGNPLAWQSGLAWSRVCYTFQPELTDVWFGATGAFRQETDLSPVFQNSVFWVITESLQCFY